MKSRDCDEHISAGYVCVPNPSFLSIIYDAVLKFWEESGYEAEVENVTLNLQAGGSFCSPPACT